MVVMRENKGEGVREREIEAIPVNMADGHSMAPESEEIQDRTITVTIITMIVI